MQKLNKPTFAVLFSVNQEKVSVRRFALLRQYLSADYGNEIKIIDHTSLIYGHYKLLIILEADSYETVENALAHCKGIVETEIRPVSGLEISSPPTEKRYAVFVRIDETKKKSFTRNPADLCAAVKLQTRVEYGTENRSAILLIEASSTSKARQYGEFIYPQAHTFVTEAVSPQSFLSAMEASSKQTANSELSESKAEFIQSTETNFDGSGFSVFNEGAAAVFIAPEAVESNGQLTELDYHGLFKNVSQLSSQQSAALNTGCYIWSSLSGQISFNWKFWYAIPEGHGNFIDRYENVVYQYPTNAPFPTLYSTYIPEASLGFDISKNNGFHRRTPLYFWLNDILNSTKYDEDFPEKSYAGDNLDAYNYFLGKLPGNAKPYEGRVPSAIMQSVIDLGCPPNIKQQAFNEVGSHLVKECSFFETADHWFGLNGVFSAIYSQISQVQSNDLTSAAALMQIQDPTQNVMTTVSSIFSILESVASFIPYIGGAISSVMSIGLSAAELIMGGPNVTNAPIEESIAKMADKINSYLSNILKANTQNHQTIAGNWGKLKTFAEGTIADPPMLSENDFGITYEGEGNVKLPQNYIDAAIKAWKIVVYQTLFAGFHTPLGIITTQDNKPGNPWNPDAGDYEFVFSLDGIYPDSNGNPKQGFIAFDCKTDAPTEVMKVLFGTNSELNLNPLMFFAGFNGWKANFLYDQGYVSFTNIPGSPPFTKMGIIN